VALEDVLQMIARLLVSWLFLLSGYRHLVMRKPMAEYARASGVPMPLAAVVVTGLMMLAGGLSLLLGWHPRLGAALIFVFLVAVAFWVHRFWTFTDPMQRATQEAHFWKNIALAGAMLWIIARTHWPWPWALG
jgi:putative oxidoreductase